MDIYSKRKSIRKYKAPEDGGNVTEEQLTQILEAARCAPSAKNRQPWKFIVYRGKAREEILDCMERGITRQKKSLFMPKKFKNGMASADNTLRIMREAPIIIMVLNTRSNDPLKSVFAGRRISEIHDSLSIGAAIENMLLKATELGVGSLWIGNTVYAHKEITEYMNVKCQLAGAVALGIADEQPEGRPRHELSEIVEYRS